MANYFKVWTLFLAEKLPTQIIKPVNPDKILRDKASQKPRPTLPVVPIKCPVDTGKVSPAEAPIILSLPRTTKSDSYELLWKPRDGGSPVLEYIVKHRKVKKKKNKNHSWIQNCKETKSSRKISAGHLVYWLNVYGICGGGVILVRVRCKQHPL